MSNKPKKAKPKLVCPECKHDLLSTRSIKDLDNDEWIRLVENTKRAYD